MPIWRVAALVVVAAGCGRKDPPAAPPPPVAIDPEPGAAADAGDPTVAAGAKLWGTYCKLCHGAKGEGYAADQAPSLISETFLATATDDFLRAGIGRGRPGTAMAGYARSVGGPLDEKAIDQIVAFLRAGRSAPEPLPALPIAGDTRRGHVVYDQRCRECHGLPMRRGEAPHLANMVFLETATDEFVKHAVIHGRPGTKMVAYGPLLPAADIDAVVAYIRTWAKPGQAPAPPTEPTVPKPTQVVINPKGKQASFTLRDDRFVASKQVKAALDAKRRIIILDARAPSDWIRMHIPGSIPAPYYDAKALEGLPNDGTWIVAYCACPHHASGEVVDALRKKGYKKTAILDEGILHWDRAGYPLVKSKDAPPSMPHDHDHHHHGHDHGHGANVVE